jgi:hypothetical protein
MWIVSSFLGQFTNEKYHFGATLFGYKETTCGSKLSFKSSHMLYINFYHSIENIILVAEDAI